MRTGWPEGCFVGGFFNKERDQIKNGAFFVEGNTFWSSWNVTGAAVDKKRKRPMGSGFTLRGGSDGVEVSLWLTLRSRYAPSVNTQSPTQIHCGSATSLYEPSGGVPLGCDCWTLLGKRALWGRLENVLKHLQRFLISWVLEAVQNIWVPVTIFSWVRVAGIWIPS